MCARMCPLTAEEAQDVLDARGQRGAHTIRFIENPDPVHDAYPGSVVPVYVPSEDGSLAVIELTWGFPLDGKQRTVFNTRIEKALEQLGNGRHGMWTEAIESGCCLVPVRAFYESSASECVVSEKTGKKVRRQYRFRLPGARAFLLAGIQADGHFSVVTTEPNAGVAPVHDRMPLVLGLGESSVWLRPDFASLINRSSIQLENKPEH